MPEEIYLRCVYCKREFNVEWQGRTLTTKTGVCGKKPCIKEHAKLNEKKDNQ